MSDENNAGLSDEGDGDPRWLEYLLGLSGWDPPTERLQELFDCDGDTTDVLQAVGALMDAIGSDNVRANTDGEIEALTTMLKQPWAQYVDPDLSRGNSDAARGTLVVLWECSDHSYGLHHKGGRGLTVLKGMDEIVDLHKLLEAAEEDLDVDEDEASSTPTSTEVYLTEEDLELRRRQNKETRDRLEREARGEDEEG